MKLTRLACFICFPKSRKINSSVDIWRQLSAWACVSQNDSIYSWTCTLSLSSSLPPLYAERMCHKIPTFTVELKLSSVSGREASIIEHCGFQPFCVFIFLRMIEFGGIFFFKLTVSRGKMRLCPPLRYQSMQLMFNAVSCSHGQKNNISSFR